MSTETPMMRQWADIKRAYPQCLVLFRLGDFYEAFNEDARTLAEVCEVTLTSRPVKKGERAPMAGVPFHAVDGYIAQLVRRGIKVALVEQGGQEGNPEKRSRMSPGQAADAGQPPGAAAGKGIMKRDVVRVVTPGTLVEGDLLDPRADNWLVAVAPGARGDHGLAMVEATTGQFHCAQFDGQDAAARLVDELARLRPAELIYPEGAAEPLMSALREAAQALDLPTSFAAYAPFRFDPGNARRQLLEHFGALSLAAYGCEAMPAATAAAGAAVAYLSETQRGAARQIQSLSTLSGDEHLHLDAASRRNLEISVTLRGDRRQGTLLSVLDRCSSVLGARQLRRWLEHPLRRLEPIVARQDAVAALVAATALRQGLRADLAGLPDLERLVNRLLAGYGGPRELQALATGLEALGRLAARLAGARHDPASWGLPADPPELLVGRLQVDLEPWLRAIRSALADSPPSVLGLPGLIREGYDEDLDAIHRSIASAREWMATLESRERARTGIKSLKVGYNRVFGYTISISNAHAGAVPADYERRQTLAGAERYVTADLKQREQELQSAEEQIVAIESRLFAALIDRLAGAAPQILAAASEAAELDVLACLAEIAAERRYVRPVVDASRDLEILAGRHPVLEAMAAAKPFVPTDLTILAGQVALLTGPNMAGKSTVGRQAALIVLLAQMGAFVPADAARVGLVDRVFTRIGAQDELGAGRSTFMVEMVETAEILHHATPSSLIILDELGRGTSTYDGMAIAAAVIEQIHDHPRLGARTLFATHFHELTALAERLPRLRNLHMAVAETGRGIAFLHQVLPGSADRSYGVHVAELAGLPRSVLERAWAILATLEAGAPLVERGEGLAPPASLPATSGQLSLFGAPAPPRVLYETHPALERLRAISPDGLTPLAALNLLDELVRQSQKGPDALE